MFNRIRENREAMRFAKAKFEAAIASGASSSEAIDQAMEATKGKFKAINIDSIMAILKFLLQLAELL